MLFLLKIFFVIIWSIVIVISYKNGQPLRTSFRFFINILAQTAGKEKNSVKSDFITTLIKIFTHKDFQKNQKMLDIGAN